MYTRDRLLLKQNNTNIWLNTTCYVFIITGSRVSGKHE